MAKISEAFRQKMLGRKKSLTRKGVVIDKKDWTKGRLRLLPSHGEDPAREFKSFYIKEMKKSVTAPCTFGVVDPLWEYLDTIYQTGEKADKDHAKDYCNRSTEYWVSVIVRGDEGTAENPNVRIFRLPYKAYQYIVDLMSDEDYAEDITDADEGRDILLKKEGKGVNTEWKPDKMDKAPISDDQDLYDRLVELSHTFDPVNNFFSFVLDDYVAAYEGLTNEELPEEAMEALQALADGDGTVEADAEEEGEEEAEYEEAAEDEDGGEESDVDPEMLEDPPEGIEFGVTAVSFTAENEDGEEEELQGVVQSWGEDPDKAGEYLLVVLGEEDDPEDPWMLDVDDVEILEDEEEPEPEEEEEPEEVAPTVRRGKKKASKKKAAKKVAKVMPRRPAAAKQIRAGKAASKKTAPKKAAAKKAAPKKASKKKAAKKKASKKKATRRPRK